MDNNVRVLRIIVGFSPEEMASFEVLHVTETFKKTLVRNGGLFLGRLYEAQGNYIASFKRRGTKARFNLKLSVEGSIYHAFNSTASRIDMYVSYYADRDRTVNRGQMAARVVQLVCEELSKVINKEVNSPF